MGVWNYIEYGLARMLINFRGRDEQLFFKGPAFAVCPNPTFEIESPDCGKTNCAMTDEYSQVGTGRMPELKWPTASPDVKEWLIISEDPDAPLPAPIVHGIYYSIPPTTTSICPRDFELVEGKDKAKLLKSGFKLGKNRHSSVYTAPRPPLGHGPHR